MRNFMKAGAAIGLLLCLPFSIFAQKSSGDLGFSGQFFFSYERLFEDQAVNNEFTIKRGYITFERDLSSRASIRFTQDVSLDKEGDGRGNIELRLKYALINISADDWGIFTNPNAEFGVVRRPWIDFEQKINDYRAQGSMFLDEKGILSSADYGVTLSALLGGEMNEEYQENIQSSFAGRLGSVSMGIYNGGGYSALEENNNKLIEGRLSLRPMPRKLPGFQTSFVGSAGKGNLPESPDFWLSSAAISYESEKWATLLQGFTGTGDAAGQFVTAVFESIDLKGWSLFTELKPFQLPISLTFRADELVNRSTNSWEQRQGVAGIAYRFENGSKLIVDVNRTWENSTSTEFTRFEVITEVRF